MKHTEKQTIREFIEAEPKTTMKSRSVPERPDMDAWGGAAQHYTCTLERDGAKMVLYFSQGSALRSPPTAEDVLDCLASDAVGVCDARSFEEWASDYGYEEDSRKAEKTFRAAEKQTAKLRRFLGYADFDLLVSETERE